MKNIMYLELEYSFVEWLRDQNVKRFQLSPSIRISSKPIKTPPPPSPREGLKLRLLRELLVAKLRIHNLFFLLASSCYIAHRLQSQPKSYCLFNSSTTCTKGTRQVWCILGRGSQKESISKLIITTLGIAKRTLAMLRKTHTMMQE